MPMSPWGFAGILQFEILHYLEYLKISGWCYFERFQYWVVWGLVGESRLLCVVFGRLYLGFFTLGYI